MNTLLILIVSIVFACKIDKIEKQIEDLNLENHKNLVEEYFDEL